MKTASATQATRKSVSRRTKMPSNSNGHKQVELIGPQSDTLDTAALLTAMVAVRNGDFAVRLPVTWTGVNGKIADTFNDVVATNERLAQEFERVSRAVGREQGIQRLVKDCGAPPQRHFASNSAEFAGTAALRRRAALCARMSVFSRPSRCAG